MSRKLIYFERLSIYREPVLWTLEKVYHFFEIIERVPEVLPFVESFSFRSYPDPFDVDKTPLDLEERNKLKARLESIISRMRKLSYFMSELPTAVDIFLRSTPPLSKITTLDIDCFDSSLPLLRPAFPLLTDLSLHSRVSPTPTNSVVSFPPPQLNPIPNYPRLVNFHISCEAATSSELIDFIRSTASVEVSLSQNGLLTLLMFIHPVVEHLLLSTNFPQLFSFQPLQRFSHLHIISFSGNRFSFTNTFFVDLLSSTVPIQSIILIDQIDFLSTDLVSALLLPRRLQKLSITYNVTGAEKLRGYNPLLDLNEIRIPVFSARCPLSTIEMIIEMARGRGTIVEENYEATKDFITSWEEAMAAAEEEEDSVHYLPSVG